MYNSQGILKIIYVFIRFFFLPYFMCFKLRFWHHCNIAVYLMLVQPIPFAISNFLQRKRQISEPIMGINTLLYYRLTRILIT